MCIYIYMYMNIHTYSYSTHVCTYLRIHTEVYIRAQQCMHEPRDVSVSVSVSSGAALAALAARRASRCRFKGIVMYVCMYTSI